MTDPQSGNPPELRLSLLEEVWRSDIPAGPVRRIVSQGALTLVFAGTPERLAHIQMEVEVGNGEVCWGVFANEGASWRLVGQVHLSDKYRRDVKLQASDYKRRKAALESHLLRARRLLAVWGHPRNPLTDDVVQRWAVDTTIRSTNRGNRSRMDAVRIRELRQQGFTDLRIAQEFGVHEKSISRYMRQHEPGRSSDPG